MRTRALLAGFFVAVSLVPVAHAADGVPSAPLDKHQIQAALACEAMTDRRRAIMQAFMAAKIPVLPLPKGVVDNRFDPAMNVVYWNASAALQTADDTGKGTGKYISPALLLLDVMAHAVAYAQSAHGYATLEGTPDPLFGTLEQRRVVAGLSRADADPKLHDQTPAAVADANTILDAPDANGLENAAAATLGEPIRTNTLLVLQDGKPVEGVTYKTVDNPTWHSN